MNGFWIAQAAQAARAVGILTRNFLAGPPQGKRKLPGLASHYFSNGRHCHGSKSFTLYEFFQSLSSNSGKKKKQYHLMPALEKLQ